MYLQGKLEKDSQYTDKKYLIVGDGRVFVCYFKGVIERRKLVGNCYKPK